MEQARDKKGKFLPGKRPVGRAKGTTNKVTSEVREKIQQLVDSYSLDQMKLDLMELDPGERLKILSGLLDFIIPKLNRTDHALQSGNDIIVVRLPAPAPSNSPGGGGLDTPINEIKEDDNRLIESRAIQSGLPDFAEGQE